MRHSVKNRRHGTSEPRKAGACLTGSDGPGRVFPGQPVSGAGVPGSHVSIADELFRGKGQKLDFAITHSLSASGSGPWIHADEISTLECTEFSSAFSISVSNHAT